MVKTKADNQYTFEAFYHLVELINFENFINSLKEIYERLLLTLNNKETNYQTKIIILKIFSAIAKN